MEYVFSSLIFFPKIENSMISSDSIWRFELSHNGAKLSDIITSQVI